MADVGDILNDDEFFGDVVDTPKEGIEQHKKRECLKGVIDKDKAHLFGHKWTHGRVDKASDEIINKTYAEYKQRELTEHIYLGINGHMEGWTRQAMKLLTKRMPNTSSVN